MNNDGKWNQKDNKNKLIIINIYIFKNILINYL